MRIKKWLAGTMAAMMLLGSCATPALAASTKNETKPKAATEVQAEKSAESKDKKPAATKDEKANEDSTKSGEKSTEEATVSANSSVDDASTESKDTGKADEEKLPYDVKVDKDGNYTFSFGDWEWSSEDLADLGTDAVVSSKVDSYLNLRSGSGLDYEVIGKLIPGEEVQIIGEDGDWYEITIPEKTGYVYKDYVELLKNEELSGSVNEEFLTMMLFLMMSSMQDTEAEDTSALTPEGNLTLVDDIGPSTGEGRQFITLVTKSGNYFYLIIDRNDDGEENVHFLNMVDEADLFALMDEDQVAAYQAAQDAANAEEIDPAATAPTTTEEDAEDAVDVEVKAPTKKNVNMLPLIGVIVLLMIGGGGYFFMQTKKKQTSEQKPDPDADYEDDEDEYNFPEEEEEEILLEDDLDDYDPNEDSEE